SDEISTGKISTDAPEFVEAEKDVKEKLEKLLAINGKKTVKEFHKRLGKILWDYCGMSRNEAGLQKGLELIDELQKEFWQDVRVPGEMSELNQELERAVRVADFFEVGKLMITDALNRKESCGAHFREESQTEGGEAMRDDENYAYVSAWEFVGEGKPFNFHKEDLKFENVELKVRSYK
ncbi:MAG: fumarate reductase/succinate dehydrogenase flavoprotein subunit, partial [Bacteroidetes bacterium]|nr:fumarate reductase/succinate dehydrogenase flavoprotein subunit [Bacteroidota bacterium]